MTLPRTEVVHGYQAENAAFEALLRTLNDEQWSTPTRCEGWVVSDVAAHVVGGLQLVVQGRVEEFTQPGHVERQIAERAGRAPKELADEYAEYAGLISALLSALDDSGFDAPLGGVAPTVGAGLETLWYDTYVHIDDIRSALGLPSQRGDGLRASVSHLTARLAEQGFGPATIALEGIEPFDVPAFDVPAPDADTTTASRQVTGDPLSFVLAATGRLDPTALGLDESVNVYRS